MSDPNHQTMNDEKIQCECHTAVQIGMCNENCDRATTEKPSVEGVINREFSIRQIKNRILDEYQKHPELDWAELAARKIIATQQSEIARLKAELEEVRGAKFPTFEDAVNGITDSRFTTLNDHVIVRTGARIMYDQLHTIYQSQKSTPNPNGHE